MSCIRVNGVSVSAPLILVSALCNFKVSVGSQFYIHVDFKMQVFDCYDVMSFVCS